MQQNEGKTLFGLLVILAIIALGLSRRKWKGSGRAYGTARWASEADLVAAGMLSGMGLVLGRTRSGALIRYNRYTHLAVFAPTGAGKGVSFLVPWLLSYRRGSVVVLDVKGELFSLTAKARRALGQKVWRLDPFGVCGPGADCWNILDRVHPSPDCVDELRPLAEAMVIRSPDGDKDPHWNDQAANVLTALLVLVVMQLPPEERTLSSLRDLVADPDTPKDAPGILRAKGDVIARLGGVLGQFEDKERAGVFSTVHRHTTWLDSPAIMRATGGSSFDIFELLAGKATLYVILPPSQLEAQNRWLRLVIASLIRLIGQYGMAKGKECLMLLDEAGQLQFMPQLEQGLTVLRSYGLKMAFFFQSTGQLKAVFREKEAVLLDNTEHIFFGTNSYETSERISKMAGEASITVESANETDSTSWQAGNQGSGDSRQRSHNFGRSWQEIGRALLKPDEVLQLPANKVVIFLRGLPPLLCTRVFWYRDPAFRAAHKVSRFLPARSCLFWLVLAAALAMVLWGLTQ